MNDQIVKSSLQQNLIVIKFWKSVKFFFKSANFVVVFGLQRENVYN